MKSIMIIYRLGSSVSFILEDDAKADACYAKLKEAFENYNPYANDKEAIVTVETGLPGDECSIKVAEIATITLTPIEEIIKAKVREALIQQEIEGKIAELTPNTDPQVATHD